MKNKLRSSSNPRLRLPCLNEDCSSLVKDLIKTSKVTQNWSEEKKIKYFTKIVQTAQHSANSKPENKIKKLIEKIKHKVFCFLSKLVVYVP